MTAGRGERGATLMLVLGFVVIVGLASSSLLQLITSGAATRSSLDKTRNREYDADGAIEQTIAAVRQNLEHGDEPCGATSRFSYDVTLPNRVEPLQVDCKYTQTVSLAGFLQRNAQLRACAQQQGSSCPSSSAIVTAQVNFQSQAGTNATKVPVEETFIQSWTVNQ